MTREVRSHRHTCSIRSVALLSVSCLAIAAASSGQVRAQVQQAPGAQMPPAPSQPAAPPLAQQPAAQQPASSAQPDASPAATNAPAAGGQGRNVLPPVTIDAPQQKRAQARPKQQTRSQAGARPAPRRAEQPVAAPVGWTPNAIQAAWPESGTQAARTGEVG